MVAKLKTKGREEVKVLRRRVLALAGLERISKGDADNLVDLLDEVDAYICKMQEKPYDRESRNLW